MRHAQSKRLIGCAIPACSRLSHASQGQGFEMIRMRPTSKKVLRLSSMHTSYNLMSVHCAQLRPAAQLLSPLQSTALLHHFCPGLRHCKRLMNQQEFGVDRRRRADLLLEQGKGMGFCAADALADRFLIARVLTKIHRMHCLEGHASRVQDKDGVGCARDGIKILCCFHCFARR